MAHFMEEMLLSPERQAAIRAQKMAFLRGGQVDRSIVRDIIAESWERSYAYGIDPVANQPIIATSAEYVSTLEKNATLIEIASSFIDNALLPSLLFQRSSITFTDERGIELCSSRKNTGRNEFFPRDGGKDISTEDSKGTNAIGTCIALRDAVEIFGEEHFADRGSKWACTAAPVFDDKEDLRGVLFVTQPCTLYHPHTLGMVKAVAFAISGQLRLKTMLRQQQAMADLMEAGAIILSPSLNIEIINGQARNVLRLGGEYRGRNIMDIIRPNSRLEDMLHSPVPVVNQEMDLTLQTGKKLSCMISCYRYGGGLVLLLSETRRMRSLAVQLAGTQAAFTFDQIIGESPAIVAVREQARMVAGRHTTILLLGESGTGKELFAQAIHNASPRANKPFVAVNCGAIPRSLVESELFGYAQGTFTGGDKNGKPGKFELADEGTIFLDEIGDMPLDAQVALLRLLQNGEVTRVGGKNSRKVSVRVIAATNRNLQEAIAAHVFRADLYYRLNVFPLQLPPLSARSGDVPLLAVQFLHKFSSSLYKKVKGFTREALCRMNEYTWPGNIRELENVVERAVNICPEGSFIDVDSLPPYIGKSSEGSLIPEGTLYAGERVGIIDALRQTGGNIRAAAKILGVSRGGLYVKMKRFGLNPDEFR
ncbi:sigma-54-dependent Fis family transcriptional regulator [Mailhella massiliensis]|uniref:Sigma 54-interacting transcriptional regulator n=1 Tax=Mailhella massiliensis TaxID=1903261 RepID=A0A921DRY3_9BACT|nr:sigma 54-interacting transcriptional regulator [Mailhella massiliensis]HJD96362.1 sigma 54-interacting transcriptional regulator [Mailhella massiliensis]